MLSFDNSFLRDLPGDPSHAQQPRAVPDALWSSITPTPVAAPRLLAHSPEMAQRLGLSPATLAGDWLPVLAGNGLRPGMAHYATNYGGHQFGQWAGQLGDGRATFLGEALTPDGERLELQLKGAGPTPYSRRGDGRAQVYVAESHDEVVGSEDNALYVLDGSEAVHAANEFQVGGAPGRLWNDGCHVLADGELCLRIIP